MTARDLLPLRIAQAVLLIAGGAVWAVAMYAGAFAWAVTS